MRALLLLPVAFMLLGCLESRTVQSTVDADRGAPPEDEVSVDEGLDDARVDAPDGGCVPDPSLECGPDGCGGLLPICAEGEACQAGHCVPLSRDCGDGWCAPHEDCHVCPADCACGPGQACDPAGGRCVCAPQCGVDVCGPDRCAGTCGLCPGALFCLDGTCACAPRCVGRACGSDGCGGSCGDCAQVAVCDSRGLCVPPPQDCGDGICDWREDCATCEADCGPCCGDGVCIQGEDCRSCEIDCGACCGDGVCDPDETCEGCPADCGCPEGAACEAGRCVCAPQCEGRQCGGDGCGGVCGACAPPASCADNGVCLDIPDACGDGQCGEGEGCLNCPADCGACCGDGLCADYERCDSCPEDCGCPNNALCNAQVHACVCVTQCEGKTCGPDGCGGVCGVCGSNQMACQAGVCVCIPQCDGRVCGSDGCGGSCGACPGGQGCDDQGACVAGLNDCGDGLCGLDEDCLSCPADCPQCCGDGACLDGEVGCAEDCGVVVGCGDGECAGDERCDTCPQDCGCPAGEACEGGACVGCLGSCEGRECGDDGCGGDCGACPGGVACQAGRCGCSAPGLTPPTSLGFNYAPQGFFSTWMGSEFPQAQEAFERDLLTLTSLDVRVVRLVLFPYATGLRIEPNLGPNQWDVAELNAVVTNLPHILERFAAHDIQVILALSFNVYFWGGPDAQQTWWEFVYGRGGFDGFTSDLLGWQARIIEGVEGTAGCANVLYYDLHNDVLYETPQISGLVRAQLAAAALPDAKIGLSLRDMNQIATFAADIDASGRQLGYVDFHTYPERGLNTEIPQHAAAMRARFPQSRLVMGEVGSVLCENGMSEDVQATTLEWIFDQGAMVGADAVLNWMLWDLDADGGCEGQERVGLGFNSTSPRNVYGWLVERRSALSGGDFEGGVGGWSVERGGGEAQITQEGDAPTIHSRYLRLTAGAQGVHWACSPDIALDGSRVAVSAYLRSNQATLLLKARFTRGGALVEEQEEGIPNAQQAFFTRGIGRFTRPEGGADRVAICVGMTALGDVSPAQPATLDVDGFSLSPYTPR